MRNLSALSGIGSTLTTLFSNQTTRSTGTMNNLSQKLINLAAILGLVGTPITLTACNQDAPGQTLQRGDLELTLQLPAICSQSTGKPAFCSGIKVNVIADLGDTDLDGVIDPFSESITLDPTGLTAAATLTGVPSSEQQVIPLDLTYDTIPTGWSLQSSEGGDAPKRFYFYPLTGDDTDTDTMMGKLISLRIVATGGNTGEDECKEDVDCANMQVCIAGECTGGNGEGQGCGTDDPCIAGLDCVDNVCKDICHDDSECGALEKCNADGKCIEVPCKKDSDCKANEYCDEPTNTCHPTGCQNDGDCVGDQTCNLTTHMCVDPECSVNSDCAADEICVDNTCKPKTGCDSDDDCGAKQICDLGTEMCEDVECKQNSDCAANEICNMMSHTCQGIQNSDYCTRPEYDTNTPNKYGNWMLVFGGADLLWDADKGVGLKSVVDDVLFCMELTPQQMPIDIDIANGPKYNNLPLCSIPNVNEPNKIKCDGTNLPNGNVVLGQFEVSGTFGNAILNVGVQKDTPADAPYEPEFDLSILGG